MRVQGSSVLRSAVPPLPFTEARYTVFVVDDDISVRESLELLIRCAGWQPVLFASAKQFLAHERPDTPSCLVLDVTLPDLNGLDLQARVAAEQTSMPIVFITGHGDVPMTVRAMKAGAVEFLTKPLDEEVLLCALRNALERSQAAQHQQAKLQALRANYGLLSRREREVMTFVVSGLLNKEVGAELGISEITVKAHRGKVMQKMRASSLPDLVNMATGLGLPPALKADSALPALRRASVLRTRAGGLAAWPTGAGRARR